MRSARWSQTAGMPVRPRVPAGQGLLAFSMQGVGHDSQLLMRLYAVCTFRVQALLGSHTRAASSTEAVAAAHAFGEYRAPRPLMLCILICRLRRNGGAGAVRTAQGAPAAAGGRDVRRELDHGVRHRRRLALDRWRVGPGGGPAHGRNLRCSQVPGAYFTGHRW